MKSTFHKLIRSPTGLFGIIVIVLFSIFALLGYLITPDSTPQVDNQHTELAKLKPGTTITFFLIPREEKRETSIVRKWLFGAPITYEEIPIKKWKIVGNQIIVEKIVSKGKTMEESYSFFPKKKQINNRTYLLGTDRYGRDVLSRMILGARISLSVGFIAVFISLSIGVLLGLVSGYYGGKIDAAIMWLVNVMWSLPTLLLVVAISFILGKGFWQIFIAVGLSMWVDIARIIRGQVMSIKEKEYISAAKVLGIKDRSILFRHILPNIKGPIIVIAASNFASAILLEAGLSFLGLGVEQPAPSWGMMANENYAEIIGSNAYLAIIPGIAIMLLVMAFNLLGNSLRDAMDVKM